MRLLPPLLFAAFAVAPLGAQVTDVTPVDVVVQLRGGGDTPVAGVFVELVGEGVTGMSDGAGRVVLSTPPGTYLIRTNHVAYHDVATALVVPEDPAGTTVVFGLSFRAIPLPPILVEAEPVMVELDRRMAAQLLRAKSFDYETIQGLITTDVLAQTAFLAGLPLTPCGAWDREEDCWMDPRFGGRERVCLIVDEHPFPGGLEVFQSFPTGEIARIEVHRSGEIRVYTRRFFERFTDPRDVQPLEATKCGHAGMS